MPPNVMIARFNKRIYLPIDWPFLIEKNSDNISVPPVDALAIKATPILTPDKTAANRDISSIGMLLTFNSSAILLGIIAIKILVKITLQNVIMENHLPMVLKAKINKGTLRAK